LPKSCSGRCGNEFRLILLIYFLFFILPGTVLIAEDNKEEFDPQTVETVKKNFYVDYMNFYVDYAGIE
jgi:hypothetical protein